MMVVIKMYKKVVVFGGGTGISYLLKGLKDFPVAITAVISVSDDGKSTGTLRKEFNTPAVGDIRKVISNMSNIDPEIKELIEYRFKTNSDLNGHPIGNLILTAMLDISGSLKDSINALSKLLDVNHTILPLSEDKLTLVGKTKDNEIVEGEANITASKKQYAEIFYKEEPHVVKEVLAAIKTADLIILSMGSLYTSIIPHLICAEINEALKNSKAEIMYLCNAMTQPGETDNYGVSDHIQVLNKYLYPSKIDVVIASNSKIKEDIRKKYETEEQKDPVFIDYEKIKEYDVKLIESDLLTTEDGTLKHNSLKLSSLVFSYLMGD